MALFWHYLKLLKPKYPTRSYNYEIPERYRNAVYLANASFFDNVNWFLHRAYEVAFSSFIEDFQESQQLTKNEAIVKIQEIITTLEQCNSIIDIRFPVRLENGKIEVVRGFRAQHGCVSGFSPSLGGLRISELITRDHMKALSVLSTYKLACMEIKLSGASGGIKIDPAKYSDNDLKKIVQMYAEELKRKGYSDGFSDIIEPDINSGCREMGWIASCSNHISSVGKPASMGGLENYENQAAKGIYFALDYFLNHEWTLKNTGLKKGISNKTFIIQGLGRLGSPLARYLQKSGAILIGVKEKDCFIYNPKGIDVEDIINYKNKKGSIMDYKQVKPCDSDEIYIKECDILVFAAHHNSLIYHVSPKVKAKLIVEAANAPISPTSHRTLISNKKLVLPDIYVNTGASVASYLELLLNMKQKDMKHLGLAPALYSNILDTLIVSGKSKQLVLSATTQKIMGCAMDHDVVAYAIEHVMVQRAEEILNTAKTYKLGLDLRTAAYIIALKNIFNSINVSQNNKVAK